MFTSLSELYFRVRRFIPLVRTKKSGFSELWQQHKQLKTMEMREAWPDIYDEGYITYTHTKFTSSSRNTQFKDIFPWNISQMITNTILISMRMVISYEIKQGVPFWVWQKVNGNRQPQGQNFPMDGKPL